MHTPLKVGDRVENAVFGPGTVTGFAFNEGEGESVCVVFDTANTGITRVAQILSRYQLQRVRGTRHGVIQVGR